MRMFLSDWVGELETRRFCGYIQRCFPADLLGFYQRAETPGFLGGF